MNPRGVVVAVVLLLAAFLFRLGGGCTSEKDARDVLQRAGYSKVEIKDGYQWLTCGKGDVYATGFWATNPKGTRVEGTVCCGFGFKGCTIRF